MSESLTSKPLSIRLLQSLAACRNYLRSYGVGPSGPKVDDLTALVKEAARELCGHVFVEAGGITLCECGASMYVTEALQPCPKRHRRSEPPTEDRSDIDFLAATLVDQENVLNECEHLLKELLKEDGVECGFDNRLERYWEKRKELADWRSRELRLAVTKVDRCTCEGDGEGQHEARCVTQAGETVDSQWLIRKRGYYYRPNRAGYTANVAEAGRYTEEEAKREAAIEPSIMQAIPLSQAESESAPNQEKQ